MTDLKVGDKVPDTAALDTLPVGTAVTLNGSKKLLTKHAEGWAQHRDGTHTRTNGHGHWWEGMEIVSLPEAYIGPMPGDEITSIEQLAALPGNAVIARTPQYRAQKIDVDTTPGWAHPDFRDQWHDMSAGGAYPARQLLSRHNETGAPWVVESLPDAAYETVKQFQWRFRDLAITGAERAQGSHDSATRVLNRIGIEFDPSVGMRITSQHDRDNLPEGSRVYIGRPEVPDSFGLFLKQAGGWTQVFGKPDLVMAEAVAVTVDGLPDKVDPDPWLTEVASHEDREAVAVMKKTVWEVGFREKQDRSWCDEFERVMLRGGLSEEVTKIPMPGGLNVGDQVAGPEAISLLPIGTMLRVDRADGFTIFQRVPDAPNAYGTRQLVTTNRTVRHYSTRPMTIIKQGTGVLSGEGSSPASVEEMDAMPSGTMVTSGTNRYVKVDNRWRVAIRDGRYGGGTHASREFQPGGACRYRYDFSLVNERWTT